MAFDVEKALAERNAERDALRDAQRDAERDPLIRAADRARIFAAISALPLQSMSAIDLINYLQTNFPAEPDLSESDLIPSS